MSLALVQGYSSEEEEVSQIDSDDEIVENENQNESPTQKPSMPLQSTKGSLLPSAFDAFSEVPKSVFTLISIHLSKLLVF